jgi:hypothetical protein
VAAVVDLTGKVVPLEIGPKARRTGTLWGSNPDCVKEYTRDARPTQVKNGSQSPEAWGDMLPRPHTENVFFIDFLSITKNYFFHSRDGKVVSLKVGVPNCSHEARK